MISSVFSSFFSLSMTFSGVYAVGLFVFFCDTFDECICLESVYILPFDFQVSNGSLVFYDDIVNVFFGANFHCILGAQV